MMKFSEILPMVCEVALWITIVIINLLLSYNVTGIEPVRRGLFCDDVTIAYPYRPDTVSDTVLVTCFLLGPIIIILVIEALVMFTSREFAVLGQGGSPCQKFLSNAYRAVGSFLFGIMASSVVMETTKLFAGRLRPNFMSVCDLDRSLVNCSQGYVDVTDVMCRNPDQGLLIDSRKSFPSGHASFSAFAVVYISIYLYERFIWAKKVRIFIPTVQTGMALIGVYICVSRVSDNKHHPSDVIAGALLGVVSALLVKFKLPCARLRRQRMQLLDTSGSSTTVSEDAASPSNVIDMKL